MIYLVGEILPQMYLDMAMRLDETGDSEIFMNSEGGDLLSAIAIYDRLVTLKNCTITATGECSSGANIIMQAGKIRRATPHTQFYVHLAQIEVNPADPPSQGEQLRLKVALDQVIFKIMTYRMTPEAFWEALKRQVFDAATAKRLGLIDEVWDGH